MGECYYEDNPVKDLREMGTIIHHYTNIEVLSLILKNRTLRFNRLDRVDDPEESNFISNGVNLGPYTFVSRMG